MQKQKLRDFIQNEFLEITEKDKKSFNENIFEHFKKIFPLETPLRIGSYISKNNEVSTKAINKFILEKGSSLYLPKIKSKGNSKKLKFLKFSTKDGLELGDYGILEPKDKGKSLKPESLDLIIIPIRGLNKTNKRLGFGGGYYDRSLSTVNKLKFIGICYEFQKNLSFRSYDHDIEISTIIFPTGYFRKA